MSAAAFHVINGRFVTIPEPVRDEVEFDVAMHLEAWTDETSEELFERACATLRAAGIRVKAAYAPNAGADPESASALSNILYP